MRWNKLISKLKLNKSNKAQVAMEFIFTYGWALLIIVVVFSVLLAMGVFTPKAQEKVTFLNNQFEFDGGVSAVSLKTTSYNIRIKPTFSTANVTGIYLRLVDRTGNSLAGPCKLFGDGEGNNTVFDAGSAPKSTIANLKQSYFSAGGAGYYFGFIGNSTTLSDCTGMDFSKSGVQHFQLIVQYKAVPSPYEINATADMTITTNK
jgi:hypothetical protein